MINDGRSAGAAYRDSSAPIAVRAKVYPYCACVRGHLQTILEKIT